MPLAEGQLVVNGKYHILRLLGAGGMARVWLAEEIAFRNRQVAIKEPLASLLTEDRVDLQRRFMREVQICAALEEAGTPNTVHALTAEPHEGTYLLVMQYMPGGDLACLIRQSPEGLSVRRVVEIARDTLHGLEAVHRHPLGIVHRDLKPSNILFDQRGVAHVADFGVAQITGSSVTQLVGSHPGSPRYMAPEQMTGAAYLSPAADFYALGCLLFEALTGKDCKRYRPGTKPSDLRGDIPPWLDAVIAKCLENSPWDRWQSATEMLGALEAGAAAESEATIASAPRPVESPAIEVPAHEPIDVGLQATVPWGGQPQAPPPGAPPILTPRGAQEQRTPLAGAIQPGAMSAPFEAARGKPPEPVPEIIGAGPSARPSARPHARRNAILGVVALVVVAGASIGAWVAIAKSTAPPTGAQAATPYSSAAGTVSTPSATTLAAISPMATTAPALPSIPGRGPIIAPENASQVGPLRMLVGHTSTVLDVAFSPDGRTLASAGADNTIRLWNADTAEELRQLRGHESFVYSLDFSPDGRTIVSGSEDETIRVWDAQTGAELLKIAIPSGKVTSVTFSPDGRTIASAGSDDRIVHLWDSQTGHEIRLFMGHTAGVRSVAFSPDGGTLASGAGDKTVRLWNALTGRELAVLAGHAGLVSRVTYSPDGRTVTSASSDPPLSSPIGDYAVRFWDVQTDKELRQMLGHIASVYGVDYSLDGRVIVSGSADDTMRLWDPEKGTQLIELGGHGGVAWSVAFSPDGRVIASADRDAIRLWGIR